MSRRGAEAFSHALSMPHQLPSPPVSPIRHSPDWIGKTQKSTTPSKEYDHEKAQIW
jgi:hypothetical protein